MDKISVYQTQLIIVEKTLNYFVNLDQMAIGKKHSTTGSLNIESLKSIYLSLKNKIRVVDEKI